MKGKIKRTKWKGEGIYYFVVLKQISLNSKIYKVTYRSNCHFQKSKDNSSFWKDNFLNSNLRHKSIPKTKKKKIEEMLQTRFFITLIMVWEIRMTARNFLSRIYYFKMSDRWKYYICRIPYSILVKTHFI